MECNGAQEALLVLFFLNCPLTLYALLSSLLAWALSDQDQWLFLRKNCRVTGVLFGVAGRKAEVWSREGTVNESVTAGKGTQGMAGLLSPSCWRGACSPPPPTPFPPPPTPVPPPCGHFPSQGNSPSLPPPDCPRLLSHLSPPPHSPHTPLTPRFPPGSGGASPLTAAPPSGGPAPAERGFPPPPPSPSPSSSSALLFSLPSLPPSLRPGLASSLRSPPSLPPPSRCPSRPALRS